MSCGPRDTLAFILLPVFTALLLQQPGQLPHGFLLSVFPNTLLPQVTCPNASGPETTFRGKAGLLESLGFSLFIAWLLWGSHDGLSPWLYNACPTSRVPPLQHCDVGPPQSLQPVPTHDTAFSSLLSPMSSHQTLGKQSLGLTCTPLPFP